jgi:catechol 2,3-dioxygenase-like lactoylglutathione lyase family enzyme
MYETILNKYAINQIMYYVDDLEKAAKAHSKLFGSGPFLYMDPVTMTANYRGKEIELTLACAYGQFGNLQIELEKVLSKDNPFAELGHHGFHHVSIWVDDIDAAIKEFADAGFEPLFTMTSGGGMRVAFIDTLEAWGHYVEMHVPQEGFWNMVAAAAKDWDGTNVYRKFGS